MFLPTWSQDQSEHWQWLTAVDDRVVARFMAKQKEAAAPDFIARDDGPCSLWTGAWSKGGNPEHRLAYGSFRVDRRRVVRAHIFAALVIGTWRDTPHAPGLHVDHRCKQTLCVAPLHLEPVTPARNLARRWGGD